MPDYNLSISDNGGIEKLTKLTLRKSAADTVRDAIAVYSLLATRVLSGKSIYIGTSKDDAIELSITTLESLKLMKP